MSTTHAFLSLVVLTVTFTTLAAQKDSKVNHELGNEKKVKLFDGVNVIVPNDSTVNATGKLLSFEVNTVKDIETGRGKSKKLLQRILPMFIMPFLIQSTIVPIFLSMLKFMLFKSLMIGKLALGLIILNAFRNHNSFKGRQDAQMADIHYGYHGNGMEEYGAYFNS